MSFENLLLDRDGAVALLTINRPQVLNALNTVTLKIDQTLAGTVNDFAPGEINLDVYADSSQYDRFAAGTPNERAIFFLRTQALICFSR